MITVTKIGKNVQFTSVKCKGCDSELQVAPADWKKGEYGSEAYVNCPLCNKHITKPGTEYRGDF